MLIAITGAQSSGKSSVINHIKYLHYPTIERKTSRSIMTEWGVTLPEINADEELTKRFQEECVVRKLADEKQAAEDTRTYFTERSYADLFIYALITLGKNNAHSEWIDKYYQTCKEANKTYKHIFFLNAGKNFIPQHDGVRGSNKHYARMVDVTLFQFTHEMSPNIPIETIGDGITREPVETIVQDIFRDISYKRVSVKGYEL